MKIERKQCYDSLKVLEQQKPRAIIQAVAQHFRKIGANDTTHVLKTLKDDQFEIGAELRKHLKDSPEKLPQVSEAECLAYILNQRLTWIDCGDVCMLVNTPGNYQLLSKSCLALKSRRIVQLV